MDSLKDESDPIETKIKHVKRLGQLNEGNQVEKGLRDAIHPLVGYVNEHGDPADENKGQELLKEFGVWFNKVRVYIKNNEEEEDQ